MLPEDNVVDDWVIETWCARAKRKNRIAQLKRTIARLKREKEEAYHRGHKAGYDLGFSRYWF